MDLEKILKVEFKYQRVKKEKLIVFQKAKTSHLSFAIIKLKVIIVEAEASQILKFHQRQMTWFSWSLSEVALLKFFYSGSKKHWNSSTQLQCKGQISTDKRLAEISSVSI